jgi:hypothetical protein
MTASQRSAAIFVGSVDTFSSVKNVRAPINVFLILSG